MVFRRSNEKTSCFVIKIIEMRNDDIHCGRILDEKGFDGFGSGSSVCLNYKAVFSPKLIVKHNFIRLFLFSRILATP
jgi:hypothetical protein